MSSVIPAHDYGLRQLDRWAAFETGARLGEARAVHEFVLAARRLQHSLDLVCSPRDPAFAQLRRYLVRSYGPLSGVAESDALIGQSSAALARKAAAHRDAWLALYQFLAGQRDRMLKRAQRTLAVQNGPELYEAIRECLTAAPQYSPQTLDWQRVIRQNRESIERSLCRVRRPSPAAIHFAMNRAARLRVLCEIAHGLGWPGSAQALIESRTIERHLDSWRCAIAFEHAAIRMLDRRFLSNQLVLAIEVEKLILKNRGKIRQIAEKCLIKPTWPAPLSS